MPLTNLANCSLDKLKKEKDSSPEYQSYLNQKELELQNRETKLEQIKNIVNSVQEPKTENSTDENSLPTILIVGGISCIGILSLVFLLKKVKKNRSTEEVMIIDEEKITPVCERTYVIVYKPVPRTPTPPPRPRTPTPPPREREFKLKAIRDAPNIVSGHGNWKDEHALGFLLNNLVSNHKGNFTTLSSIKNILAMIDF
ncbi:12629_t:CDS:2, partial [Ambispora gerdemannii]